MSELVNKKANQGTQDLDLFKMPEAQPGTKTIDLNLSSNVERLNEQKPSSERPQVKNDFAFPTEGLSAELLKKLDLTVSKESREREARAEKEIDELRAQALRQVVKPIVDTSQTQDLKNKIIKSAVITPPPREDLSTRNVEATSKKDFNSNRAPENAQVIRTQDRVEPIQVVKEQVRSEPLTKNETSQKLTERENIQTTRTDNLVRQAVESQKEDIAPTQTVTAQLKKAEEIPIREPIKYTAPSTPNIQPERVAKIIAKPEVRNDLTEPPVETVRVNTSEVQRVLQQKPEETYRPVDNKLRIETNIEPAKKDALQSKNDIQIKPEETYRPVDNKLKIETNIEPAKIDSLQAQKDIQLKTEETYRPVINQEQHIDTKLTAEVSLPQVERKPIPEPQLQSSKIEEKSAPVLSVDTFMKPAVTRLEEQDLELLKELAVKRNTQDMATSPEISNEKETDKNISRKQVLDQEFIRLKPQGYVDTILDKLVSLFASLLKKLEALFFGKSTKAKDIKSLKALRAAELEQFMLEKEQESRAQKIAKSSRARKNIHTEDEEDLS